jgi:peptidoglycan/LPS O-acetylase OafA/YrhL
MHRRIPDKANFWGDAYLWSEGWALFCFFASASFPWLVKNRFLEFFAKISYPLYLVHGVPGYILMVYFHRQQCHPLMTSSIAIVAAIFMAYILHCWCEQPLLRAIGKWRQKKADFQVAENSLKS